MKVRVGNGSKEITMKINGKEHYCMGEEYTCEVCGHIFIPTSEWIYRSALTKRKVCSYKCRSKTEHEKNERLGNILEAKNIM